MKLAQIWRHPIKSHGRELLSSVMLTVGQSLPWDRHWAIAHDRGKFDPDFPAWTGCGSFIRGAIMPETTSIECVWDEDTATITLTHPSLDTLIAQPDTADGASAIVAWSAKLLPDYALRPTTLAAAGRAMTDTDYPSVSVNSLSSVNKLSDMAGVELVPQRWRGNLWVDGVEAFDEFNWIGKRLHIGEAILEIIEPIERCKMTTTNPATGIRDYDTLALLRENFGHQDFGVYARVIKSGQINIDDNAKVAP